jgi:hypothetical protein
MWSRPREYPQLCITLSSPPGLVVRSKGSDTIS